MNSYTVAVPGVPKPWSVNIRRSAPPAFLVYQGEIQGAIRAKLGAIVPLTGPLELTITFVLPLTRTAKRMGYVTPDLTNLVKAAEDACQGILFENDSQIIKVTALKRYLLGDPCTIITVRMMEGVR